MASRGDSDTLDPARCGMSRDFVMCQPIFGTLLRYNSKTEEFEPAMAESIESKDGQHWTLKLREGVKFTDGTPFDADAVDFNWKRAKDPEMLSGGLYYLSRMEWEVVDPLTIEVTLDEPDYDIQWALVYELGAIGSPTAIKKLGDDFGSEPVGAGPFVIEERVPESHTTYVRNPDYWEEGLPYLDKLTVQATDEDDQRVNLLRAGQVDITGSHQKVQVKSLEDEGFIAYRMPLWGGTGFGFNLKEADIKDEDLFMALQHAFNAEQISKGAFPLDQPPDHVASPDAEWRDDSLGKYPEHDLAEAQRRFDAYLSKSGQSSKTINLLTLAGFPPATKVTDIVQAQFNKIEGLEVEVEAVSGAAYFTALREGDYQVAFTPVAGELYGGTLYRYYHSTGDMNYWGYSNPDVDAALEEARRSSDPAEATAALKKAGGQISKDAPVRLHVYETDHILTAKNVHLEAPPVYLSSLFTERIWISD